MYEFKESKAVKTFFHEVFSVAHTYENFYNEGGNYKTGQFRDVKQMYSKKEYRCKNHTTPTPLPIVTEMLNSAFCEQMPNKNSKILVLFTLEIVYSLVYNFGIEFKNITFFSDHETKTEFINTFSENTTEIIIDKEKLMSKKFDFVFGNPPYVGQSYLHQQIFNNAVDLVKDNGYVVFIQPASPYHNKKTNKNKDEAKMIENILKYRTKAKFHHGAVFDAADVGTDVVITTLQKTKSIPVVNQVTYKNGNTYEKMKMEEVSITEFDPALFRSIYEKLVNICKKQGSVGENTHLCPKKKGTNNEFHPLPSGYVPLPRYRGHQGKWDFFTIIVEKNKRQSEKFKDGKSFGVFLNEEYQENFYDYLESFVARIGLSMFKFNASLISGELNLVPMFDFSRTYTDEELYQMVGLTEEEIIAIENFLPDYYGRKA